MAVGRRIEETGDRADKFNMSADSGDAEDLTHLIYSSSAAERFDQRALKGMLEICRRNNEPRGITGLLLYRDGQFLQYLEGTRAAVAATYAHIKLDRRHSSARIVRAGALEGRVFPQWLMGYKNLAGIRAANTAGYSECLQTNFQSSAKGDDPADRLAKMFHELPRP
jgi:hypothetical protein